ncbi:hypothetical protein VCRLGP8_990069 [Vibrio crassostreae]|nr:hypothetical protein VCRLGP8_990069 [Vibrio crassostreae]
MTPSLYRRHPLSMSPNIPSKYLFLINIIYFHSSNGEKILGCRFAYEQSIGPTTKHAYRYY